MAPNPVPIPDTHTFDNAVAWTIRAEGGARLVSDTGGLTKYGISKRAHPDVDVANLTREQAVAIYHNRYWTRIHGDQLPPVLALVLFDTVVNLGIHQGVKLLQKSVGEKQDGIFGPKTLAAARGWSNVGTLLNRRLAFYSDLARSKPVYLPYESGWRRRVVDLALEAGRWLERGL